MFISQQKLKDNIAEYVLYMYQIEDVIRAYNFDLERIKNELIVNQVPSESFVNEYVEWYKSLISEMKTQGVEKQGHLNRVKEVHFELVYLHNTLLTVTKDPKYLGLFERAEEHINAFKTKSNLGEMHPLEICFHALYMKLLLKLQKKEISPVSEEAFDAMRIMLAYVAQGYHKMKSGDVDFLSPHEN